MKTIEQQLLEHIDEEYKYLSSLKTGEYLDDKEKRSYAMLAKLSEEVGELSESILESYSNVSRNKNKKTDISKEIADVIIVSLILARHLEINVPDAIDKKINIIKSRRARKNKS